MKELLKSFLKIAIIFILVGSVLNDVGAVMVAGYYAQDTADTVASAFAAEYNETDSQTAALYEARVSANKYGVTMEHFKLNPTEVSITIRVPVNKTVYISRIEQLSSFSNVTVTGTAPVSNK